jgi:hypothetical protein
VTNSRAVSLRHFAGTTASMLWTIFIILGIVAFALIIVGRR